MKQKLLFFILLIVLCLPTRALAVSTIAKPTTDGLVGWWTFDTPNMTATLAKDTNPTATKHDGTLSGSTKPTATSGKVLNATSYNATSAYINVGNLGSLLAADFTVSAWVYPTAFVSTHSIFGRYEAHPGFAIYQLTSGAYQFETSTAGGVITNQSGTKVIPLNTWGLVTATRSGSTCTLYVNGIKDASGACSNASFNNGGSAVIGTRHSGTTAAPYLWGGKLDDVRLYNRALSAAEVYKIYVAGGAQVSNSSMAAKGSNSSGLVGWWTFDNTDTTATRVFDKSTSNNNGTLTGTKKVAPGVMGQAFSFDGTSNYVTTDANIGITGSASRTVTFWMKPSTLQGTQVLFSFGITGCYNLFQLLYDIVNEGLYAQNYCVDASGHTSTITRGKWNFVALTFSNPTVKVYINGNSTPDINASLGTVNTGASPLKIGVSANDVNGYSKFNGDMDDFRVYNRALSVSEIAAIYQLGSRKNTSNAAAVAAKGPSGGLVYQLDFDGGHSNAGTSYLAFAGGGTGTTTATAVGGVTKTKGKIGQGVLLDGTTGYVNAGSVGNFPMDTSASSWTVNVWTKRNSTNTNDQIFQARKSAANNQGVDVLWVSSPVGAIQTRFTADNGSSQTFPNTTTLYPDTKWHMVSLVYTGGSPGTIAVYVDSKLDASTNGITSGQTWSAIGTGGNLDVGAFGSWASTNWFDGRIDDFRVYNRALTASEVYNLYMYGK